MLCMFLENLFLENLPLQPCLKVRTLSFPIPTDVDVFHACQCVLQTSEFAENASTDTPNTRTRTHMRKWTNNPLPMPSDARCRKLVVAIKFQRNFTSSDRPSCSSAFCHMTSHVVSSRAPSAFEILISQFLSHVSISKRKPGACPVLVAETETWSHEVRVSDLPVSRTQIKKVAPEPEPQENALIHWVLCETKLQIPHSRDGLRHYFFPNVKYRLIVEVHSRRQEDQSWCGLKVVLNCAGAYQCVILATWFKKVDPFLCIHYRYIPLYWKK